MLTCVNPREGQRRCLTTLVVSTSHGREIRGSTVLEQDGQALLYK
jgi:hypothetical protein